MRRLPRPAARAVDLQTSATLGATLARRSEGAQQHLFKVPLEQLELSDLVLHGRELTADHPEQVRTKSRVWRAIQDAKKKVA